MKMMKFDVVVAGGGPAGLVAARSAAEEGGKVLLLELQSQIGGQTKSATWIPTGLEPEFKRAVVEKVEKVKLHSPHRELMVKGEFGSIVDRRIFDKLLAAKAVAKGVDIWVGSPVRELLMKNGRVRGVQVETGGWSEQIGCEVVVDATGTQGEWSSIFLRKVMHGEWDQELLTLSNEYLMANAGVGKQVEVFFSSYAAPLGHAWVYPFGEKFALVGIRGKRIHPDAALDEFLSRKDVPALRSSAPVAEYRGYLPLGGWTNPSCSDGIIAAGSATGQIYSLSGCGIKYAMRCGELAGKIAIDAVANGDVSKKALEEYDRRWRSEFGAELKVGDLLSSSLSVFQDQKWDAILQILEGRPEVQRALVLTFLGAELESSVKQLLADDRIKEVFGDVADKVLGSF